MNVCYAVAWRLMFIHLYRMDGVKGDLEKAS